MSGLLLVEEGGWVPSESGSMVLLSAMMICSSCEWRDSSVVSIVHHLQEEGEGERRRKSINSYVDYVWLS